MIGTSTPLRQSGAAPRLPNGSSPRSNQIRQGHDFDLFRQRIPFLAGIHDAKFIEPQVGQGDAHGRRQHGRVHAFALDPDSAAALEQQEVDSAPWCVAQ